MTQTLRPAGSDFGWEFQTVFETRAIGIAFISQQGEITQCNEKFAELYHLNPQDLIQKIFLDILAPEDRAHVQKEMKNLLASGAKSFKCELNTNRKDSSMNWAELTLSKITDSNGQLLSGQIAFLQDTTEKQQLKSALVNASKLTALGEMAGGIAHEINNPLAIIQGKATQLLKLLLSDSLTNEMGIKSLDKIVNTTERIAKIVRGLKSFTRNADQDPVGRIELKELMDNILGLCTERFYEHGVKLEVSRSPEVTLQCRVVQIEQVIVNLLNNAYDAIEIFKEKWIRIDYQLKNKKLQIWVTDCGPGIPADILEKLMQPFFTTKSSGKGTGLGLSISKRIIEAHEGRLTYDGSSGNTRFVVELPI
jgi:PAS domain S-box-containing protein